MKPIHRLGKEGLLSFLEDGQWNQLPKRLQEAPYFTDGRLLFKALENMLNDYFGFFQDDFCSGADEMIDSEMIDFRDEMAAIQREASRKSTIDRDSSCTKFKIQLLSLLHSPL